jgi:hypothetical protein
MANYLCKIFKFNYKFHTLYLEFRCYYPFTILPENGHAYRRT